AVPEAVRRDVGHAEAPASGEGRDHAGDLEDAKHCAGPDGRSVLPGNRPCPARARTGPGGSEETHALEEPAIGGEVGRTLRGTREIRDAIEGLPLAAHVTLAEPCLRARSPGAGGVPPPGP